MDRLAALDIFVRVVDTGSFSAVARNQQIGQPAVSNFMTIFFPNGRPSDPSQNPQMTAAQFVAAIGNPGLSGLNGRGWARAIPVPAMAARGFGQFYGSGLYADLNIPLPTHPSYGTPLLPEAAQRARNDDAVLLMREAEELINRLLNGAR